MVEQVQITVIEKFNKSKIDEQLQNIKDRICTNNNLRPKIKISETDGNVFLLANQVKECLNNNGIGWKTPDMMKRLFDCNGYDETYEMMKDYVEFV